VLDNGDPHELNAPGKTWACCSGFWQDSDRVGRRGRKYSLRQNKSNGGECMTPEEENKLSAIERAIQGAHLVGPPDKNLLWATALLVRLVDKLNETSAQLNQSSLQLNESSTQLNNRLIRLTKALVWLTVALVIMTLALIGIAVLR